MNWRALPSVYIGEGSVSLVSRISRWLLLKLKTASPPRLNTVLFFQPAWEWHLQPNRMWSNPEQIVDLEVWIMCCRFPLQVSDSWVYAVIYCLWFLYCVSNGATVMQNQLWMLDHNVDVSDYTSLYLLISYSYFSVWFCLLFLCLVQGPLDQSECQICFHEKTCYKKHPKNRCFVKSSLRTESPSHGKMTPLMLVRWI